MFVDDDKITHVLVSLMDIPLQDDATGHVKVLIRLQEHNRNLITQAAELAGLSQQKFMRTVLVNAAKKILTDAGVQI